MPRTKNEQTHQKEKEETVEVENIGDPLQPQEGDTPEMISYRKMLGEYQKQSPEKYEQKKEEFLKKLNKDNGMITSETVRNPKGVIRTTFQVPDIQTKVRK